MYHYLQLVSLLTFVTWVHSTALLQASSSFHLSEIIVNNVSELPDDGILDEYKITPKIISQYGYPVESHYVTTEDGYILGVYRIPHGKNRKADPQKKPVYLQHGFGASSADWVLAGPNISTAFLLADEGYDVWLGNIRGNTYSRRHVFLNPDESTFWKFSFHEMGLYDLPAIIDYILEKTNNKQLLYIGQSMGTTMFYVMSILRPEYNDKILGHISLAPIAYIWNIRSLPIRALAPFGKQIKSVLDLVTHGELLSRTPALDSTLKLLCTNGEVEKTFCLNLLFFIFGSDPAQIPTSFVPSVVSDITAGLSTKTAEHLSQLINSKRFCQYDYGTAQNLLKYNSPKPPDYNIAAVKAKSVLIYGDNDLLATEKDVHQFYRQLPAETALGLYKVNYTAFMHLDFVWATDIRTLLNNDVLEILSSFETNETPNIQKLIRVENV